MNRHRLSVRHHASQSGNQASACVTAFMAMYLLPQRLSDETGGRHPRPCHQRQTQRSPWHKGSAKNNLVEFAPEFAVYLIDLIEQNRRNSELFRGLLRLKID